VILDDEDLGTRHRLFPPQEQIESQAI